MNALEDIGNGIPLDRAGFVRKQIKDAPLIDARIKTRHGEAFITHTPFSMLKDIVQKKRTSRIPSQQSTSNSP